jgi:hypothetical protein
MKIRPVGAELFHADRRIDIYIYIYITKLTVAFRNYANAPENSKRPTGFRTSVYRVTMFYRKNGSHGNAERRYSKVFSHCVRTQKKNRLLTVDILDLNSEIEMELNQKLQTLFASTKR